MTKQLEQITVPADSNKLIQQALENINKNEEVKTLWKIINVNAIDRLGMTDHGIVHFQIVANIGLKLTRTLYKKGVELNIVKDYDLSRQHSELVVLMACLFHDLGMTINRAGHEEFSLIIARDVMKNVLDFLPIEEKTIVISEALHCIISHRKGGTPYTIEAGIVRVADALDMSAGRSRISYEAGSTSIHSLSATAIDGVEISEGEDVALEILIKMNNSSGVFQVDELLKKKLAGSGLEKHVRIKAIVTGEAEKKLLQEFEISL